MQAVLIAAAYSEDWPLLIVCPAALRNVWENHLREWLPKDLLGRDAIHNIASGRVGRFTFCAPPLCSSEGTQYNIVCCSPADLKLGHCAVDVTRTAVIVLCACATSVGISEKLPEAYHRAR